MKKFKEFADNQKIKIEGIITAFRLSDKVTQDVMEDCKHCGGKSFIKKFWFFRVNCPSCEGYGYHLKPHPLLEKIRDLIRLDDWVGIGELMNQGLILGVAQKKNLIVTVGRTVLAERLAGGTTYTGEINYGALGDDNTPVTNADVALGNEVFRKVAASQTFDENIAYIDFFYTAADTDGTYEEWATFIDGAAGVDTGQLWSHILTGGWTKSALESLFVSCKYTIS